MNYDKSMIDLIQEIRRRADSEDKPGIKLANPELFNELIPIYQGSDDAILKALTKELFHKAGEGWSQKLEAGEISEDKYVTKVYRGRVQLVSAKLDESTEVVRDKPKKMYRGRVVA
ncbi:hypothetical protein [Litoribacillus peritrichatus]|uniref:Uncharacterized protein n=1 Tax=Litoribacillus peritrichatus TaxID=718191 RepID=A0ABP7NAU2_9GAMM